MRRNHILRLNGPQHPSSAVKIDTHRPSSRRFGALGRETPDSHIRTGGLFPGKGVVDGAADRVQRPGAGDEDAAGTGGGDGLQVDLLLVEDVGVVEGGVLGVDSVDDGVVEGVGGLVAGHGG